jgi:hypothetical protein
LLPNVLMHQWQLNMLFFLATYNGMFCLITLSAFTLLPSHPALKIQKPLFKRTISHSSKVHSVSTAQGLLLVYYFFCPFYHCCRSYQQNSNIGSKSNVSKRVHIHLPDYSKIIIIYNSKRWRKLKVLYATCLSNIVSTVLWSLNSFHNPHLY